MIVLINLWAGRMRYPLLNTHGVHLAPGPCFHLQESFCGKLLSALAENSMKSTVHRASVPKLVAAAKAASGRIEETYGKLQAEIDANTEPAKGGLFTRPKLPETVTYKTGDIRRILEHLVAVQLELDWWSTPPDERARRDLPKPFSLR
jgi:hypothetical protein